MLDSLSWYQHLQRRYCYSKAIIVCVIFHGLVLSLWLWGPSIPKRRFTPIQQSNTKKFDVVFDEDQPTSPLSKQRERAQPSPLPFSPIEPPTHDSIIPGTNDKPLTSVAHIEVPPDYMPAKLTPGHGAWGAPPQALNTSDASSTQPLELETTETAEKVVSSLDAANEIDSQSQSLPNNQHTALPETTPDVSRAHFEEKSLDSHIPTVDTDAQDAVSTVPVAIALLDSQPPCASTAQRTTQAAETAAFSKQDITKQALANLVKAPLRSSKNVAAPIRAAQPAKTSRNVLRTAAASLTNLPPGFLYSVDRGGSDFAERDGDPNKRPSGLDLYITNYEYRIAWYIQKAMHYASQPSPAWWGGDVAASFRIEAGGELSNIEVYSANSTSQALDWLRHIVKQAGPIDPIPAELHCSELDVVLIFSMNMIGELKMQIRLPLAKS